MTENSHEIFAHNITWRLKAHLEKTGESYAQFARRLDLPYGWLIRITTKGVKQTSRRTYDHLEKLAGELGIKVHWLWWEALEELPEPQVVREEFKKRHPSHFAILKASYYANEDGTPKEDIKDAENEFRSFLEDICVIPDVGDLDDVCAGLVELVNCHIRVVKIEEVQN